MQRLCVSILVLLFGTLGAGLSAADVLHDADEIYIADASGQLWKHGSETPSRIPVGPLPAVLTGLAFGPGDLALYGLTEDRRIWRLDPDTAEVTASISDAISSELAERYQYRDLVAANPGELILLRWDWQERRPELTRVDKITGAEILIGAITLADSADPFAAYSMVGTGPVSFLLMDHRSIRLVDLDNLVAYDPGGPTFATEYPGVVGFGLDMLSNHPRAWVLSERTEGETAVGLVPIDIATGAILQDAPSYTFAPGLGARAMALREADSPCPQDVETLCLQEGRFAVRVDWRDFEGVAGEGRAVADRSRSAGQFWFFEPDNRELLLKVIEGCAINGHFWVSVAGTTNVEFTLTVTDTSTSSTRTYSNPLGQLAQMQIDIGAFSCVGGGAGS